MKMLQRCPIFAASHENSEPECRYFAVSTMKYSCRSVFVMTVVPPGASMPYDTSLPVQTEYVSRLRSTSSSAPALSNTSTTRV